MRGWSFYIWQLRIRSSRIIVPITDTAIDPRQPSRLEKKANIVRESPLPKGAVVNRFVGQK